MELREATEDDLDELAERWDDLNVGCEFENEGARRFYREASFEPKQIEYAQPLD
jgi:hypothetical protein